MSSDINTHTLTHTQIHTFAALQGWFQPPSCMVLLALSQAINLAIACVYWSVWHRHCNPFSLVKRQRSCPGQSQRRKLRHTHTHTALRHTDVYSETQRHALPNTPTHIHMLSSWKSIPRFLVNTRTPSCRSFANYRLCLRASLPLPHPLSEIKVIIDHNASIEWTQKELKLQIWSFICVHVVCVTLRCLHLFVLRCFQVCHSLCVCVL